MRPRGPGRDPSTSVGMTEVGVSLSCNVEGLSDSLSVVKNVAYGHSGAERRPRIPAQGNALGPRKSSSRRPEGAQESFAPAGR
jgi:hypothetical protein